LHLLNKILTVILIVFLTSFSLLFILLPDQAFSETENRMLQKKPAFSWDNLISGKFGSAVENYVADQFACRDIWVSLKSAAELILQKKDNNGVYFGREGYLLQKPDRPDAALLAANIEAVNQFAANIPTKVYFLLAPSSVQILTDKLPQFVAPHPINDLLALTKEQLSPKVNFIDTFPILAAHRQEYIYYKTDHHWTTRGAYYAYREAGPLLDYKPLAINDFTIEQVSSDFYGTLHAKSGHRFIQPDTVELFKPKNNLSCRVEYVNEKKTGHSLYAKKHLLRKDKYAVFLDGNHALIRINVQNQTDRKLLVVKDSYANSLIPFLANHYDEIHVIDLRHFNAPLQGYIKQYNLNEILFVYNFISFAEDPAIRKIQTKN
jgi:hypothetical protein